MTGPQAVFLAVAILIGMPLVVAALASFGGPRRCGCTSPEGLVCTGIDGECAQYPFEHRSSDGLGNVVRWPS